MIEPEQKKPLQDRMTAAIPPGPKVLRIGLVQNGQVRQERVIRYPTTVNIGPAETNTFVVVGADLPASLPLFESIEEGVYQLNFVDSLGGRIALDKEPIELSSLKSQAHQTTKGMYRLRLTDRARGKIVVGETTFLFQLVNPAATPSKIQLPASLQSSFGDRLDWPITIIAAFSFLFHFGAIGAFYSDWADRMVDDDASLGGLVDRINRLPPPPPVEVPTTNDAQSKESAQAKEAKAAAPGAANKAPAGGPNKEAVSKSEGAALLNKLDQMDTAMIGALTNSGAATQEVLKDGNVPTGALDDLASAASGVGVSGPGGLKLSAGGGGPIVPGGGGGLANLGAGSGAEGTTGTSGTTAKVEGPKATVNGGGSVSVGKVSGADRVLAAARGRIRACYQTGLNTSPDMEGRVSFTMSIGASGGVGNASVTPSGTIGPSVVSCIKAILQALTFDAPEEGAATVSGSFSFVNSSKGK